MYNQERAINLNKETNRYYAGNRYRLIHLVKDSNWRTLKNISSELDIGETSASALLRQLRQSKYGSHTVNLRKNNGGIEYQVILNAEQTDI